MKKRLKEVKTAGAARVTFDEGVMLNKTRELIVEHNIKPEKIICPNCKTSHYTVIIKREEHIYAICPVCSVEWRVKEDE